MCRARARTDLLNLNPWRNYAVHGHESQRIRCKLIDARLIRYLPRPAMFQGDPARLCRHTDLS
jgi:hypothetical protein